MTENQSPADDGPGGISDDQLPEDLQPSEDNPLAKNPDESGEESVAKPGAGDADGSPGEGEVAPPPPGD
jgi:hypothetical protein